MNEDNSLVLDENQRREIGGIFFEEIKRKDSILMMTKNCIDRLINYKKINDCGLKNVYIFTAKGNKKKQWVLPNPDCSRCGLWPAYQVPIYKFKEWFSHKCLKYKFLFKIE